MPAVPTATGTTRTTATTITGFALPNHLTEPPEIRRVEISMRRRGDRGNDSVVRVLQDFLCKTNKKSSAPLLPIGADTLLDEVGHA